MSTLFSSGKRSGRNKVWESLATDRTWSQEVTDHSQKAKADKKRVQFSPVQFNCSVVSDSLRPHELQHARPPCPSTAARQASLSINCSTPGLPVHHQLLQFTQTHVHRVDDAIQPSHPLLSPSPPALNLPQYQGLFR